MFFIFLTHGARAKTLRVSNSKTALFFCELLAWWQIVKREKLPNTSSLRRIYLWAVAKIRVTFGTPNILNQRSSKEFFPWYLIASVLWRIYRRAPLVSDFLRKIKKEERAHGTYTFRSLIITFRGPIAACDVSCQSTTRLPRRRICPFPWSAAPQAS